MTYGPRLQDPTGTRCQPNEEVSDSWVPARARCARLAGMTARLLRRRLRPVARMERQRKPGSPHCADAPCGLRAQPILPPLQQPVGGVAPQRVAVLGAEEAEMADLLCPDVARGDLLVLAPRAGEACE